MNVKKFLDTPAALVYYSYYRKGNVKKGANVYQFVEIATNAIEKRRNTTNALHELFGNGCFTRKEFEKAFTHKNGRNGCVPNDGMVRLDDLRQQGLIVLDHLEAFPIVARIGGDYDDYVFKNGKIMPYDTDKEVIEALEKFWGEAIHADYGFGYRDYYRLANDYKAKLCAREKELYEKVDTEHRKSEREIKRKRFRLDAMKQTVANLTKHRF